LIEGNIEIAFICSLIFLLFLLLRFLNEIDT